jgi:hypothetical protein
MFKAMKLASSVVLVAALAGCASGVKRMDPPTASAAQVVPAVKAVNLTMSDDARRLVASGNGIFNQDALRGQIERQLQARMLIKGDATQTLNVHINSFRVRSSFNAIMFGFMAGSDKIDGTITVNDASGNVLKQANVTASWALGGLAGGQDASRMTWLYEEFAKHAAAELSGVPAK